MLSGIHNANSKTPKNLYRYSLQVVPAGEMAAVLGEEKTKFSAEYPQHRGNGCPPVVTIGEFHAREEMEETIIRWLQRITGEQKSFGVTLNNFSGSPMHSVFIRIQDAGPIRELITQLEPIDEYVQGYDCPPVHFMRQPHVAIAENLREGLYVQAIADYARRDFHGTFEVNELMLVRCGVEDHSPQRRAVLRLQPLALASKAS
ncbi:MAG: hypothetical protein EOO09_00830 [Chitinophagaceae bacterium]|nr:MAG: hypothetical protein EOO09_00830 [Chitinophagaceae bacterium]